MLVKHCVSVLTDDTVLMVLKELFVFSSIFTSLFLSHTLDFLESVMRYFSYCSMLKIKFGMPVVSRWSFAYHEKNGGSSDLFEIKKLWVVQCIYMFNDSINKQKHVNVLLL